jgi:serine protease Do
MQTSSSGSGFILSDDGYVVTNYHVVEGQNRLQVVMYDGTTYEAEYIGGNESNDIALIKVDAQNLPPVTIGSSSDLIVGDQVVAIGNPLGELASTLTVGYVSAKDRIVTSDGSQINMLQTDAAINPGNSGGPLFNMYGEVVGITTAKYSGASTSGATIEGIGFAIPIDDVMPLVDDLKNYGYINSAYLGVMVSDMDAETAAYYRLPMGAYVQEVTAGYCAEEAGLQAGDIIVALGEYEVECVTDLTRALRKFKAGDTTTITVWRSGSYLDLSITLDEKPHEESEPTVPENNVAPPAGGSNDSDVYGGWPDWFFGRGFGG